MFCPFCLLQCDNSICVHISIWIYLILIYLIFVYIFEYWMWIWLWFLLFKLCIVLRQCMSLLNVREHNFHRPLLPLLYVGSFWIRALLARAGSTASFTLFLKSLETLTMSIARPLNLETPQTVKRLLSLKSQICANVNFQNCCFETNARLAFKTKPLLVRCTSLIRNFQINSILHHRSRFSITPVVWSLRMMVWFTDFHPVLHG